MKIAILLSAYNGLNCIEEQIASIYNQSYTNFQLYIRDDGSSEEFVKLLRKLQQQYGFELIEGSNLGFVGSFMHMLKVVSDAELYAFADQDDIWMEDKLQVAVEWFKKREEENQNFLKIPALFHSAYEEIDSEGKILNSFYFPNEEYDFRRSITENHYSGFAMVINAKLREYMLKGNWDRIGYHDWWAAMIVQAFGEGYSDQQIMAQHRVHGDNITTFNIKTRLQWLKKSLLEESELHQRVMEFERCFGEQLAIEDKTVISLFCGDKYNIKHAMKKCFYPKRWRPILSSEIVIRVLMLVGKV